MPLPIAMIEARSRQMKRRIYWSEKNGRMALCDQLEAQLAIAATIRGELLESTIHEALIASEGN